jgi:N,N-dimethylformamidase
MPQQDAIARSVEQVLPVTGYLDRLSARSGDTVVAHVATAERASCTARLVRVVCADPNPDGPGLVLEDHADVFSIEFESRYQPVPRGSYALVDEGPPIPPQATLTWTALVYPTRLRDGSQSVIAHLDGTGSGIVLAIGRDGAAVTRHAGGDSASVATGVALTERRWYRIWATWQPDLQRLEVGQRNLGLPYEPPREVRNGIEAGAENGAHRAPHSLYIGARPGTPVSQHFNGRIEDPAVLRGRHDGAALLSLDLAAPPPTLILGLDFSKRMESQTVEDVGPGAYHGRLINLPMRAVKGSRWSGDERCWRTAPRHYAAVHFHDDDISDCGWEPSFAFEVPTSLGSGSYAFELTCGAHKDWLPFYVPAPKSGPHRRIAVLASTLTHQVYANHIRNNVDGSFRARIEAWGAYPWNAEDYPIYGASTYNNHSDGTGICYSSRLRPMLTMRPGYLTFNDPAGSGLRHYPADSQLHAWLEHMGHEYDIVTDDELDAEGVEVLRPYQVLLTGSHPEYHTANMLDALQAYVAGGGRLAYLGGNGFYWKVVRNKDAAGILEIRRTEGGIRAWAAEPGEYYHAFDGSYGGLWLRNGRPPQSVAGVGFSAQGRVTGSYYRRLPASYAPAFAWLFDGIDDEKIGDFGFGGGGAAGYELDRADARLGTPHDAVVLARSEAHGPTFMAPPEEILTHLKTVTGERPEDLVRAEMVFFRTEGGGTVFAAGSITFCGALPFNRFENNVSRLLDNLVRAFSSEELPAPGPDVKADLSQRARDPAGVT